MKSQPYKLLALSILVLNALTASQASAQAIAQATPTAATVEPIPEAVEDVVITGSRIAHASTFATATPVTAVSVEDLLAAAPSGLADGLKQLPSVVPGGGATVGGGTGNSTANFLNLRGLGAARTLTLLDGLRFTPSGPTGQIDSNLIPQGLVERVDVVTGGASAAYGSDAVGGVINFVLNKRFKGFKGEVSTGRAQAHDNKEFRVTANYGADYWGDRAHFITSFEYYDNKGVNGDARESRRTLQSQIANPANTSLAVRVDDARSPFTMGGLIVVGVGGTTANNNLLRGIKFGAGGVQSAYDYGTVSTTLGVTGGTQNGGDGFRNGTSQEIVRPELRKSLFARTDIKLGGSTTLFVEGAYGGTVSNFQSSPTTHTLTIRSGNPFIPANIQAQMTTLGVTSLTVNRLTFERGYTINHNNDKSIRGLMGLKGSIGDWGWDASYQWGSNILNIPVTNNLNTVNIGLAADAVAVTAANVGTSGLSIGSTVCRSTLTAPTNGCSPFNPFGQGAPSAASLDYIMGTSDFHNETTQQVADANISGDLFNLPAGMVSMAAGAEYRKLKSTITSDALSYARAYRLVNTQAFFGEYSIKELFAEAQIPVIKDWAFARSVDANVAIRRTDYSTSGAVQTWKGGVSWQVSDELRLRGTRSRDIRAPSLLELFAAGSQNNLVINDNFPGGTGTTYSGVPNQTFGNAALTPEVAYTSVAGFVYQPNAVRGLNLALDYYSIRINNAIANVGGQNAVQQCDLNPASSLCALVTRNPTTRAVIGVRTQPINLNSQTTRGVDVEASYQLPLASWFAGSNPGSLTMRALIGYVDNNIIDSPLEASINNAGNGTASLPHVRGTLGFNYTRGAFNANVQSRYIGRMTWDKTRVLGVTTDFNAVPASAYFDGQFSYKLNFLGNEQEVYLNMQNILDKKAVYDPVIGGATPIPTDRNLYDQVGRMFRIGMKVHF